jgi:predicted RNA binding protein YcfA (HicA-like mRNA interferase family)
MMRRFPTDAPVGRVLKALERLGFAIVREGNHVSLVRENPDGTSTPMTLPNHPRLKASTLRAALTQSGVGREDFLNAFERP